MWELNINTHRKEAELTVQWASRCAFYGKCYYGDKVKANEMEKTCS
jgi:hypothetical protein